MAATNMHCSSIVVTVVTLLFMLLLEVINSQQLQPSFCFNMEKFVDHQPNLMFEGDASVSETGVLELTKKEKEEPVSNSVGRVLYYAPFNIWDRTTNRAKSFITTFSFIVNAPFPDKTADGIAFFIAPPFSQIPMYSNGGFLGLVSNSYNDSTRQTIAVEFDTCYNVGWDPPLTPHHIGINVNSIQSVTTVPWMIRNGVVANAIITYTANMNLLNVSLLYGETLVGYVNYTVDLKNVVREWVSVGLSATVGTNFNSVESHDVLSWSFHAI